LNEFACLKQNINISPEDTIVMAHEAKLLWKLHHYSLPTLRDYFKLDDGSCVFAMTYIEGPTIDKIVEKHGGIDPEHVCWMTQRLLNALNYLHFNGVVHCDVKPNNIIVKPQEHNAVLVDYGFSSIKPRSYTKPTGYTLAFAAPELIDLKPPMPHTDLYSLAATMIYALGGNPIDKSYPTNTPEKIKTFFNQFMHDHPLARPSWEDKDLVKELSDLRQQIFGRKQSNKEMRV
ncbi:protein kinase, partial [archaeon]|nr:protein kinase [archaeon]